jgi:hypothetical protein
MRNLVLAKYQKVPIRSLQGVFMPSCVQGGSMSCPFVLRYRSMYGPDRPPFDTSGRTVLNATEYYAFLEAFLFK